jgi:hypothetical protein
MQIKRAFQSAERYIQLQSFFYPDTWVEEIKRISDMIIMPVIILCMFLVGDGDLFLAVSTTSTALTVWRQWFEYLDLQFKMQALRIRMASRGGPKIVTNNPKYMAYVWAHSAF